MQVEKSYLFLEMAYYEKFLEIFDHIIMSLILRKNRIGMFILIQGYVTLVYHD